MAAPYPTPTRTRIDMLERLADLQAAETFLLDRCTPPGQPVLVTSDLMRAFSHAGSYLAGAWRDDELVGVALAVHAGPAAGRLHLHLLEVHPTARRAGVGLALLLHLRGWALQRDVTTVSWTFDPRSSVAAAFGLTRLGAVAVAYYRDLHGEAPDPSFAGDRCLACWSLPSPLPEGPDPTTPVSADPPASADLRTLRATLEPALAAGGTATFDTRTGCYVLKEPRP